jgi:hypothetical protein
LEAARGGYCAARVALALARRSEFAPRATRVSAVRQLTLVSGWVVRTAIRPAQASESLIFLRVSFSALTLNVYVPVPGHFTSTAFVGEAHVGACDCVDAMKNGLTVPM